MKYTIDDYQININGTPDELRLFIRELSNLLDGGQGYKQIEDDLKNLENILEPHNYTFGIYNRIYYNKKGITYTPNASEEEAKNFHFKVFKTFFDEAIRKIEDNNSLTDK